MRILGIDPGLAITGWAVIDDLFLIAQGTISTKKWKDLKIKKNEIKTRERIDDISEKIKFIIFEFKPQAIAIEDFIYYGNVGKISSSMSALIENLRVSFNKDNNVVIYSNGLWKKILMNNYRANKKQVAHYLKRTVDNLNFSDKGGHIHDAIGVALAYRKKFKGG